MNAETVRLIERPFQEIVDDLLTAVVGGVVNEPIIFDLKDDLYPLAQPATDVRAVTGTVSEAGPDGLPEPRRHAFQKAVDYVFRAADNALLWLPEGRRPDDETTFHVDYFRRDSRSPLSDINVGSVTRTLAEAFGREVATVYHQIDRAYKSGFVDTATGQSLDLVVSVLGVRRKTKEAAVGLVTFFRDPAAGDGNVTIPENTLLTTDKGEAAFVTVELRTLQRGQPRIDVPVRAAGGSAGGAGIVAAGAITKLAQPIAGVNRVTNTEATVLGGEGETDEQLRARAKGVLRGLGNATLAALANAVFENRGKLVEAFDPNGPPPKRTPPGTVRLLVESEPERFVSLRAAVEQKRAAGVHVTLVARYVYFKVRVRARVRAGLTAAGKLKLTGEIIDAMQKYVDGLGAGEPARGEDLLRAIQTPKEVKRNKGDVVIVDVITSSSDVGQSGPEALVKTLTEAIEQARADETAAGSAEARAAAVSAALTNALAATSPPVPTGRRVPNRGLVQSLDEKRAGQRASDEEIEAGQFQVAASVEGEDGWVVLDVEPADIRLEDA